MSRLGAVPDQYKSYLQLSHSMITFDAALSTTKLEVAVPAPSLAGLMGSAAAHL